MKTIYVLTYFWSDIADNVVREMFDTIEQAELAANKYLDEQKEFATLDPKSIGKLIVTIDSYVYNQPIFKGNA